MSVRTLVCALLATAVGLATPAARADPRPNVLRFANADDVTTLNPVLSAETTVGLLSQLTMAYLVRYDAHNQPTPELAIEVPTQQNGGISRDGRTITWHLRHDARWSDGDPFDSHDIAFTVAAIANPANSVVSRDGFDLIERVDTPDRWTSVFHLKKPYAAFLPRFFGSPPGNPCILPRHLLGTLPSMNNSAYNALPVGIGPFRYTVWHRGESIEMEANPTYFRGRPKLDRAVYKIIPSEPTALTTLQAGGIDLILNLKPSDVPRARLIPNATVRDEPSYRFVTLAFNTSRPILNDPMVRRALEMAVDRPVLVDKVGHGLGIVQQSFVPPQYAGYRPIELVSFDIPAANRLLERSGWRLGADGIRAKGGQRLAIQLDTVTDSYTTYVELLRAWWSQIGVALDTKTYAPAIFYQPATGIAFGGHFDATIYSIQNFPFVDPSLLFECDRVPPDGLNLTRYCAPNLDGMMATYESTFNTTRREGILTNIAEEIDRATPLIVLSYTENVFVISSRVIGFQPNAVTYFDDIMNVSTR